MKHQGNFVKSRHRVWQKYKQQGQWKAYTVEINRLNRMLAGAKIPPLSGKEEECGSDMKKNPLYNLVNKITDRCKVNLLLPGSDQVIGEDRADFFLSKISNIKHYLAACCTYSPFIKKRFYIFNEA